MASSKETYWVYSTSSQEPHVMTISEHW